MKTIKLAALSRSRPRPRSPTASASRRTIVDRHASLSRGRTRATARRSRIGTRARFVASAPDSATCGAGGRTASTPAAEGPSGPPGSLRTRGNGRPVVRGSVSSRRSGGLPEGRADLLRPALRDRAGDRALRQPRRRRRLSGCSRRKLRCSASAGGSRPASTSSASRPALISLVAFAIALRPFCADSPQIVSV